MLTHHAVMFSGYRQSSSEDVMVLICHMNSQTTQLKGRVTLGLGSQ